MHNESAGTAVPADLRAARARGCCRASAPACGRCGSSASAAPAASAVPPVTARAERADQQRRATTRRCSASDTASTTQSSSSPHSFAGPHGRGRRGRVHMGGCFAAADGARRGQGGWHPGGWIDAGRIEDLIFDPVPGPPHARLAHEQPAADPRVSSSRDAKPDDANEHDHPAGDGPVEYRGVGVQGEGKDRPEADQRESRTGFHDSPSDVVSRFAPLARPGISNSSVPSSSLLFRWVRARVRSLETCICEMPSWSPISVWVRLP